MKILEVKNLNIGFECDKKFYQALWDVSFSLEKGKTLALVGESGCGKTISAMSILNLLPKNAQITGGEIIFNGQNLLKLTQKEMQNIRGKKIALIPQDPMTSLNPLFTVGNQLLEVIEIHHGLKGKDAEKKAIEAFDAVKIPCAKSALKSYPHEFSGGMKQRAIIAMALACDAEILIADEPTTALDVTIQAQIMGLIQEIKTERNTSILLITHDLALVSEYSDEVNVMYSGSIVETASVNEFFQNTRHPYSKALIASVPSTGLKNLETISGQPPTIQQAISGCRFNPRCKFKMDICEKSVPKLKEISPNHECACFYTENENIEQE